MATVDAEEKPAAVLPPAPSDVVGAPPVPAVDIDVSKLNPLSPEVISKQATINIGVFMTRVIFCLWILIMYMFDFRNNRACCTRKIYRC
jgi:hypothetical protein